MLALGLLGIGAWVYGVPRLATLWQASPQFTPLAGLAPFRELAGGSAPLGGASIFAGLEPSAATDAAREAAVRADPCRALFGQSPDPRLPVAVFSDFNCPNCRQFESNLAEYQSSAVQSLRVIRFELPLLGAASVTASKAVLAAERQGGYAALHARLRRNRMVTDLDLLRAIAEDIGLDGAQLLADMRRPEIDGALDQARAIAAVFGFYGTPGAVIGHTAFMGAISAAEIGRIVDAEKLLPPLPCLSL